MSKVNFRESFFFGIFNSLISGHWLGVVVVVVVVYRNNFTSVVCFLFFVASNHEFWFHDDLDFGHYTTVLPGPRSIVCPTTALTLFGLEAIIEDIPYKTNKQKKKNQNFFPLVKGLNKKR